MRSDTAAVNFPTAVAAVARRDGGPFGHLRPRRQMFGREISFRWAVRGSTCSTICVGASRSATGRSRTISAHLASRSAPRADRYAWVCLAAAGSMPSRSATGGGHPAKGWSRTGARLRFVVVCGTARGVGAHLASQRGGPAIAHSDAVAHGISIACAGPPAVRALPAAGCRVVKRLRMGGPLQSRPERPFRRKCRRSLNRRMSWIAERS